MFSTPFFPSFTFSITLHLLPTRESCQLIGITLPSPVGSGNKTQQAPSTLNENAEQADRQAKSPSSAYSPLLTVPSFRRSLCAASCGLPGIVVGPYKLNAGSGQLLHAIAHGIGRRFTPEPHKLPIQVSFEQFYELTSPSHLRLLLIHLLPFAPCTVVVSRSWLDCRFTQFAPGAARSRQMLRLSIIEALSEQIPPPPTVAGTHCFPTHTMREDYVPSITNFGLRQTDRTRRSDGSGDTLCNPAPSTHHPISHPPLPSQ